MRNHHSACCCALLVASVLAGCASDGNSANTGGSAGTSSSSAGSAGEGANAGEGPLDEILASSYAQWPMPNSPGLELPNAASYDAQAKPGVVHDRVTGLDWLQDPGLELYARADALDRCAELSFAGFDDWRVPTFIELISLFDVVPNTADPLDPIYIAPVFETEGRFWSTSPVSDSGLGRLLDFTAAGCSTAQRCSIGVAGKADSPLGGAFCVRNSEPPASSQRYRVSGEQVSDLRTGLTWQSAPVEVQTVDYADAVSACAALGDGARLPSISELLSILLPIIDKNAFPNWPADAFAWSQSTIPVKPGNYWTGAIGGATQASAATEHNRVECVR